MHFVQRGYDCFKYNFKSKARYSTFEARKDKYFFEKLAKRKDPKGFILANMLVNPAWIGDMVNNEEAERTYTEWVKRNQALSYIFKQDLKKLNSSFNDNIAAVNGQHPVILKMFLRGEICIETICIIANMAGCIPYWNKQLDGDPIWNSVALKIEKYIPFMTYDEKKMQKLLLEAFDREDA